jgi:PAS domain S-box-containing protein
MKIQIREEFTEMAELEKYRRIFFASPDWITFSRMDDGTYIDVSPGFERVTGYARNEAIGRTSTELGLWFDPDERRAFIKAVVARGEVVDFPVRVRVRSGDIRDVLNSGRVIEVDGEQMLVSMTHDVTERKRDEEELKLYRDSLEQLVEQRTAELHLANAQYQETNRRLEEALNQLLQTEKMASIGQLAAGVAHEINNPVGFVNSNLGSLDMYFRNLLDVLRVYEENEDVFAPFPERMKAIAAAKSKAELDYLKDDVAALLSESKDGMSRVKKIVQDLKDFSHVGALEWQWADLDRGLDSTLNIVNNEIKYKAKVVKEYAQLPQIECLPLELNQVFMNMLVNAAHAIENSGQITIRTGVKDAEVWVEFSDTGSGIAPENLKRIFDPFFTTKPVGKGTGLGLSLSYGIVQKHQGRIEVDSVVGKGTRFRIWLPVSQTAAAPNP